MYPACLAMFSDASTRYFSLRFEKLSEIFFSEIRKIIWDIFLWDSKNYLTICNQTEQDKFNALGNFLLIFLHRSNFCDLFHKGPRNKELTLPFAWWDTWLSSVTVIGLQEVGRTGCGLLYCYLFTNLLPTKVVHIQKQKWKQLLDNVILPNEYFIGAACTKHATHTTINHRGTFSII